MLKPRKRCKASGLNDKEGDDQISCTRLMSCYVCHGCVLYLFLWIDLIDSGPGYKKKVKIHESLDFRQNANKIT